MEKWEKKQGLSTIGKLATLKSTIFARLTQFTLGLIQWCWIDSIKYFASYHTIVFIWIQGILFISRTNYNGMSVIQKPTIFTILQQNIRGAKIRSGYLASPSKTLIILLLVLYLLIWVVFCSVFWGGLL